MAVAILTEQQIKQYKKFAFLYIGDEKEANEVIHKSIQNCFKKIVQLPEKEANSLFRDEVIKQCRLYTRKFNYKKDSLMKALGIKWYGAPFSGWRSINKLPTAMREVLICHYLLKLTQTEISKALQLPPGHVTGFINSAKKKLFILNEADEQKFIQNLMVDLQFIDLEEINIDLMAIHKIEPKSKKPLYIIGVVVAVVVAGVLTTTSILKNDDEPNAAQVVDENDVSDDDSTNDPNNSSEQKNTIVLPASIEPKEIDELTIKLAAHRLFYNTNYFYSPQEAKMRAAQEVYRSLMTEKFANERNIFMNEAYRQHLKGDIFKMYTYDPTETAYFDRALKELNITKEEFLEHSLHQEIEYYYIGKMMDHDVDLEPLYEMLGQELTPEEFYLKAGITSDDAKEILEKQLEGDFEEFSQQELNLPFDLTGSYLKVVQLENGDYIFENPTYFGLGSTKYRGFIENYINKRLPLIRLTRTTFNEVIEYLENYDTDYPPNKQLAEELLQIYKMLERSIEWELD